MENTKIPVLVSISRIFGGDPDKKIVEITIKDDDACTQFVTVRMDIDRFAECLLGLAYVEGEGEVRGLDKVGMKHEIDHITFPFASKEYGDKRKEEAYEAALKYIEKFMLGEGWVPDSGFNSQDSFFDKDGASFAKATIRRWVEK